MGVGQGYALAAALFARDYCHSAKVLVIQGDSAFGFSAMELETIARYKLPVITVVLNNNGISRGLSAEDQKELKGDLTIAYDKLSEALGGRGWLARTQEEIASALREAEKEIEAPSLINVLISPDAERKPQKDTWLTRSKI